MMDGKERLIELAACHRADGLELRLTELPPGATLVHVLGVDYVHTVASDGADLYLTPHGVPYARHLEPANWMDLDWFRSQREALDGTAAVYAVPSKPVDGVSLGLVVRYSRVGERVPIETDLIENVVSCEFNGPFEEVSLLEELRRSRRGPSDLSVATQRPLAIYVPPERWSPEQLQRFQWRIERKIALHPGIAIDIMREYILVYSWITGIDAWEAHTLGLLDDAQMRALNARADADMRKKGFYVLDMKPKHVIVQLQSAEQLVERHGQIAYSVIDFELLLRTKEYAEEVNAERRDDFCQLRAKLIDPKNRAGVPRVAKHLGPALEEASILGVDYVHGHAETTGGMLWVVGGDAKHFDYFLPERWRTTLQVRFMDTHETFFTTSKDKVRLVWKVSRVGERAEMAAFGPAGFRALALGINSPFEELGIALWLRRRGVRAIIPFGIYRTGHRSPLPESLFDPSRYRSHAELRDRDGGPILEPNRNYITLWAHWNGPRGDYETDMAELPNLRSLNTQQAIDRGLLSQQHAYSLVEAKRSRLEDLGVEVVRLMPSHLLVALDAQGAITLESDGSPAMCLCNFQHLRCPHLEASPEVKAKKQRSRR
jgi:hypothetical protein